MMTKFSIQFSILILSFGLLWLTLSQVPWMRIFHIEETTSKLEKELGDFYMKSLQLYGQEIDKGEIYEAIENIKEQICSANNIKSSKIKLHVVKTSEMNAFAAPDNHLIIFTGLIDYCLSFEELAGVMAHEIAHLENNHVMKKLGKEIGLSALLSIASSGSINIETIRLLTSSAYDRSMEKEADTFAVDYLIKSGIDPTPLADMMFRLSLDENPLMKNLTLISTHPDTDKRIENILKQASGKTESYSPLLPDNDWSEFQQLVK